jgi:hypothetical protein
MVRCLADNGTRLGVNLRGVYLRVRPRMEVMLSPDEQLDRSIQAMIHNVPPHSGQVSMSIAKTRWRRCIQLMGAGGWSALMRLGRYGTMRLRCLKLGAKTP